MSGSIIGPTKYDSALEEKEGKAKEKDAEVAQFFADAKKGRFKIELLLVGKRTTRDIMMGAVSFWESGAQLHGGGDSKLYFCPGQHLGRNNCTSYIPVQHNHHGFAVCPRCKMAWDGKQLIGEIMGRHTVRDWARLLDRYFVRLDSNCDIYMLHSQDDIRIAAGLEQEKQHHGEKLAIANITSRHVYPLKHIMKDTAFGATAENQFFKFLTS